MMVMMMVMMMSGMYMSFFGLAGKKKWRGG